MGLFDVHAHLTSSRLASRESQVLANARAAGITCIISNGLNPTDNQAVLALAERDPLVKPAFGLYPVDAVLPEMITLGIDYPRDGDPLPAHQAVDWVRTHAHQAFAIGEIGLDGYWVPQSLWPRQEQVFRDLVAIAIEANKPIIIHTRKREARALDILTEMGAKRVNWHCFGGRVALGRRIATQTGHYLSIPANARRSQSFTRLLETLPRERILLETDCPYMGPERGQDSEPAHVALTLAFMAELWQTPKERVLDQLEANFEALFGEPP